MRVLVTGSTGYLGRSVLRLLLERGFEVVALGHSVRSSPHGAKVDYHSVDLTSRDLPKLARAIGRVDAIVHLAGPAPKVDCGWSSEGGELVSLHIRLALALREAFPRWSGRLVHASGMPVYGIPSALPVAETAPRTPCHMYGLAKVLSEDVLLTWSGVDRWVLRLPGLFSADRRSGALFHFMRAAATGEPLRITAERPTPWDLLHVDDAAEAICRALSSKSRDPGAVNISYGQPVELSSIARWIAELGGRGSRVETTTRVLHPTFQMDISQAMNLIEWPPTTLYERLNALYGEYGFQEQ